MRFQRHEWKGEVRQRGLGEGSKRGQERLAADTGPALPTRQLPEPSHLQEAWAALIPNVS